MSQVVKWEGAQLIPACSPVGLKQSNARRHLGSCLRTPLLRLHAQKHSSHTFGAVARSLHVERASWVNLMQVFEDHSAER